MTEDVLIPFTFPEPNAKLGGLMALSDDGLDLEYQARSLFSIRAKFRKIPFDQIRDLRVRLVRPGWFRPKVVVIEISTRSLQPLRGLPGTLREKLWLWTQQENLGVARCLEQVTMLKLIE
jgi:hypothetical protein